MAEYAATGDPQRTMALLWGRAEPSGRGPKQGLSVEAIVAAAIAVADEAGIEGVSMRKVAERLGKSAMSLYTYVPGKPELLDLMLDRVQAELPGSYQGGGGWRATAEAWARVQWAFYERHPWVLQVAGSRATLGPNELDAYEALLAVLDGIGLTPVEHTRAATALAGFVAGSAKSVADARAAEQTTGISDDDWWAARSPILEEMMSAHAGRWPVSERLGETTAFEQPERAPDDTTSYLEREALDAFEFGLARLLDGIDALVSGRPAR